MKKLLIILFLLISSLSFAQLPDFTLKTTENTNFEISTISNAGKPIVIYFWSASDNESQLILNKISDDYDEWKIETGVRVIAISIDNIKQLSRIKKVVMDNRWPFEVIIDYNHQYVNYLDVVYIPYMMIFNSKMDICWKEKGFDQGGYSRLINAVKRAK